MTGLEPALHFVCGPLQSWRTASQNLPFPMPTKLTLKFSEELLALGNFPQQSFGLGDKEVFITYTTREKVADLGLLQLTSEKSKTIPLPPIVGAIALVGGIVLLVMGSNKG